MSHRSTDVQARACAIGQAPDAPGDLRVTRPLDKALGLSALVLGACLLLTALAFSSIRRLLVDWVLD